MSKCYENNKVNKMPDNTLKLEISSFEKKKKKLTVTYLDLNTKIFQREKRWKIEGR